jgi:hypothetical protein
VWNDIEIKPKLFRKKIQTESMARGSAAWALLSVAGLATSVMGAIPKRAFIDCVGDQGVGVKQREKLVPATGYWGMGLAPYTTMTVFEGDTVYFHPTLLESTGIERTQVYLFEPDDPNSQSRYEGYVKRTHANLPLPSHLLAAPSGEWYY